MTDSLHPRFYYTANLEGEIVEMELREPPGQHFVYRSGETALLGLILSRAVDTRTITDYMQERVWEPLGMEFDGLTRNAAQALGKLNEKNYRFYLDAMVHSSNEREGLPRFYLLLRGEEIVGCYALLVNDLISRQDLMPWFACLFVEEPDRGKRLSQLMFDHALVEAGNAGFASIYLTTDHEGLYEKFGWQRIEDGYDASGARTRMYKMNITG